MKSLISILALPLLAHAAANITFSAVTIAADGQTLSMTASASLTSSSTINSTCVTFSGGNLNNTVTTNGTASGTTLSFPIDAPVDRSITFTTNVNTSGGGPCNVTDGSGNTPQGQSGLAITNNSEWYGTAGTQLATYAEYGGGALLNTDSFALHYPNLAEWNNAPGDIAVNATGSAIHIWAYQAGTAYGLFQDGVQVGTRVQNGGTGAFIDITLATGLSGTHLYRIVGANGNPGNQVYLVALVRFVGGAPTGTKPAAMPLLYCFGDSICGSGSAPTNALTLDFWLNPLFGNYSAQLYTKSGECVSSVCFGATISLRDQAVSGCIPWSATSPAICMTEGGVNDQAASVTIGNNTTANTFQGDTVTMIRNIQTSSHPPTQVLVRGILPNTDTNSGNIANYVNAQAAAVAYINTTYGTNVCFYHTTGWIIPASDTSDGLHPLGATSFSGTGYGKIANRQAPIFDGYLLGSSFTVSGPSSGASGSPSTNFTVALRNGAMFQDAVTISDGGAGGVFTPSVGSPGTGTVTVTATGLTSFTFTYTPAGTGVITLTFSGLADCWTAPTPLSYTSTGGGTGIGKSLRINGSSTAANTSVAAVGANAGCRMEFNFIVPSSPTGGHPADLAACGFDIQYSGTTLQIAPQRPTGWSCCYQFSVAGYTSNVVYARVQQVPSGAGGVMRWEAWDINGNPVTANEIAYTGTSGSNSNGASVGSTGVQDTVWGFFRAFTTTVPLGSVPPVFADTGDLLEWKFNGNLNDSSGHGYNATGVSPASSCGSAPCYEVTTGQPLAKGILYSRQKVNMPSWSTGSKTWGFPWNTTAATGFNYLDCTDSYSENETSSAVSCLWSISSGPNSPTITSPTSTVTTLAPVILGSYVAHLVVTDVNSNTGSADQNIGALAYDAHGVVSPADPKIAKALGAEIAFGQNPWGYADERNMAAINLQIANNPYYATTTWRTTGTGTMKYPFGGVGIAPGAMGTTVCGTTSCNGTTVTTTGLDISVFDGTKLTLSPLPGVILISANTAEGSAQEAVRICTATLLTGTQYHLTVCYDGRGIASNGFTTQTLPGTSWLASGTPAVVGEMRVQGTSTLFATDSQRALAPAGVPGPIGPITYSTGTAGKGADSTHILGSGTTWITGTTWTNYSIRIAATHASGTPFIWWSPITTVTDATHLVVSRALPSDIDGGTFSYAIVGEMYMSLEFADSNSNIYRGLFYNVDCESETACFALPNHDVGTFNTACCTSQSGLKYSYKLVLGAAGQTGPNFYGTGLAAREFYYRSYYAPALTLANQIDENWTRDPEIGGGYFSNQPLLYGGGAIGGLIDKALNGSTALTWGDVTPWGSVQGTSFSATSCNAFDARDTGYTLSWTALLDLFDTADQATWDPVMTTWATRENQCRRATTGVSGHDGYPAGVTANSWSTADAFNVGQFTSTLAMTNGMTAFTPNTLHGIVAGMCAGVDDGSGTITVNAGSQFGTVTGGSVASGGVRIWITDTMTPYSAPYVYSGSGGSGSTITLGALWPGASGTFRFMVENNSLAGNFSSILEDSVNPPADNLANNLISQENWACHITDSDHAQLHRAWDNATATDWHISNFNVGPGLKVQPYMLGILRAGMNWGSQSPNSGVAASFTALLPYIGTWMATYGTNYAGSPYSRVQQACEPIGTPTPMTTFLTTHGKQGDGDGACGLSGFYYTVGPNFEARDRVHNAESGSAMLSYYTANTNSTTRAAVDTFYGQMFGYCPETQATYYCDANYLNPNFGNELSDADLGSFKWSGFFFGVGGLFTNSWPAGRLQNTNFGGSSVRGSVGLRGKTRSK